MPSVPIPDDFRSRYAGTREKRAWLATLPALIERGLERWDLSVDLLPGAEVWCGFGAVVVPVLQGERPAALKVAFPYDEAVIEQHALRLWSGRGAVGLFGSDEENCMMLLERLDATRWLESEPMDRAVEVWAGLLGTLSLHPDDRQEWSRIPAVADRAERWSDDLPAEWDRLGRPFERWLLEAALEVCQTRGAVGRRGGVDVLVHTDLHYMNILARAGSDDFVAIDPQPMVGEAEFAVAPLLWNRLDELRGPDPARALKGRLDAFCRAAGLDAAAATEWSITREVDNALWYAQRAHHEGQLARSLWIASTLAGRTHPGLPAFDALPRN